MADIKHQSNSGGDDPWEQLAEDLFGLEQGKEHTAISTPAEAPRAAAESQAPAVAEPPAAHERPAVEAPFDFGVPEPVVEPVAESPARESEISSAPEESAEPEPPAPVAAQSAQDSYWDALANWNWDDSDASGGRGRRGERSRREGSRSRDEGRSPRPPSPSDRPAPPRAETPSRGSPVSPAAVDDDFGAFEGGKTPPGERSDRGEDARSQFSSVADASEGLDDDSAEDDTETTAPDGAADEEGAPRKRRRRRRRRRGRGEGEAPAAPGATDAAPTLPGDDWDEPAAAEPAPASPPPPRRREERPGNARSGQARPGRSRPAAEGESRRDSQASRPPRSQGHRDQRRATPPVEDRASEVRAPEDRAPGDDFEFGLPAVQAAPDEADDPAEPAVSYDDVPSWEEAISYLLNPSQVQAEGGGDRGAPPAADQPRQTRHYGGRKGR